MASRSNLFLLAFVVTATLTAALAPAREGDPPSRPAEKPAVEQLVERLGSDEFETREAATRALLERDDALPALRQALKSAQAEVRRRAKQILSEREAKATKQRLERMLTRVKNGEIDAFVDQMVALEDHLDDKTWQAVMDLADRIWDKTTLRKDETGLGDFSRICSPYHKDLREKWPQMRKLGPNENLGLQRGVAREVTKKDSMDLSVVVSQGPVRVSVVISNSFIFANGDVSVKSIRNTLIVCDGNITCEKGVSNCVLIATGTAPTPDYGGSVVIQNAREVPGVLKFSDTRQAGVEVEEKDGIRVKKVLEGKPFAKAGVKEGDKILAIDGTKVGSYQEFRRFVRRNALADKETVFKLQRGDKTLELTVALTD